MAKGDSIAQTPDYSSVGNYSNNFFNRISGVPGKQAPSNPNQMTAQGLLGTMSLMPFLRQHGLDTTNLGSNLDPQQAPQQASGIAPTGNMMQQFFSRLGGNTGFTGQATPQQPYTQSAQAASPIAPTNPQNIAATFFKNLGAY